MKDLFSALLQRSRGEDVLSPALPSPFERVPAAEEPWGEAEEFVLGPGPVYGPAAPPTARVSGGHWPGGGSQPEQAGPGPSGLAGQWRRDVDRTALPGPDAAWSPVAERAAPATAALDLTAIIAAALRHRVPGTEGGGPGEERRDIVETARSPDEEAPAPAITRPIAAVTAPAPPAAPTPLISSESPAAPAIEVHIGRIEVVAAPAPAARPAAPPRVSRSPALALSLRDYLARRGRR